MVVVMILMRKMMIKLMHIFVSQSQRAYSAHVTEKQITSSKTHNLEISNADKLS